MIKKIEQTTLSNLSYKLWLLTRLFLNYLKYLLNNPSKPLP